MRAAVFVAVAFWLFVGTTTAQPASGDELSAFRELYHRSLARNGVVGSSLLIFQNDRTILRENYGDADRARHRAVDENTTFHWASITKTLTAIAILQLRDHGQLGLDDPVVRYVPELRAVHDSFGSIEAVTIRHLLTHSGGFRSPTWPWASGQAWEPFEPTQWSQIVAMLPYTSVDFAPGSRHSYSNLGFVFLGQIIERLSGDNYEVFVDKNILKPLGMHASYFDRAPYFLLPHRAAGYYLKDGKLSPAPYDFDSGITVSNSGLNAPVSDIEKYVRFLLGLRVRGDHYNDVLQRASLEEMFRKQFELDSTDASQTISGGGRDWVGLSFFLHDEGEGKLLVGHGGQQGGFISHIYFDRTAKLGYIIAFNTDSSDLATDTQHLDRELRDAFFSRATLSQITRPNASSRTDPSSR